MKGLASMHRIVVCVLCAAAGLMPAQKVRAASFSLYPFKVASESGRFQFGLSGRGILEGFLPGQKSSGLIAGGDGFVSGRASLFTDVYIGSRLFATGEFRLDTGESPKQGVLTGRVEQAFLRYKPWLNHNLHFQFGKFVSPFGAYNQRHDTTADPFVRPPLMYDYRTMVSSEFLPRTNDGFIRWKDDPATWRPRGAPIIWGNPYQMGFMFLGGFHNLDFRLAVMNSAPSSEPGEWNSQIGQASHPSYVAHVGYRILPELYVGMAYNTGPYLGERARASFANEGFNSYKQKTWEMEFLFERGKTQVRGEILRDMWEVVNVLDYPVDVSGYVEVKQKFLTGFYGALRFGTIRYNRIHLSSGAKDAWDFDIWRGQAALGYRMMRNLELRAEYMRNQSKDPQHPLDNLLALQCRFEF